MKLVIKEYLASLNEREELDAILPDLLSHMGLTVIGKPMRGPNERGVDVAAVGSIDGDAEKIYLYSIKSGDLTPSTWSGDKQQNLRRSLDEILDSYIPHRIPTEHENKPIVVCPCFGGEVKTTVTDSFNGYMQTNSKRFENIEYEVWNGDKLANLINDNFLHENFMPDNTRSLIRKSIALINEPEASSEYFNFLVNSLLASVETEKDKPTATLKVFRQINICLWILYSWSRQDQNLESSYLSSEIAVLNAWSLASQYVSKKDKTSKDIISAFFSIQTTYIRVTSTYFHKVIQPYTDTYGAISYGISSVSPTDINLKLFDILGRISILGLWHYQQFEHCTLGGVSTIETENSLVVIEQAITSLLLNNPQLNSPIKDEQAIDITLAALFLLKMGNVDTFRAWMHELLYRVYISLKRKTDYPTILNDFTDLLEYSKREDKEYFEKITAGSILYPNIGLLAALFDQDSVYHMLRELVSKELTHCNLQLWFPDEDTEKSIYIGKRYHGFCLQSLELHHDKEKFINSIVDECNASSAFGQLSAIKFGLPAIYFLACRVHRMPIAPHLLFSVRQTPLD